MTMVRRQTDNDEVRFAPLTCANQSLSCQRLVVGGGLSGLSAAEAALMRGIDVVLIEKGAFGEVAASALNAGQFLSGWVRSADVMVDELTTQEQSRGARPTTARSRAEARVRAILRCTVEGCQRSRPQLQFGSPTFFVGRDMFFGKDQLRAVGEAIEFS